MIRYNTKRYWGYSGDTKPVDAQIGDRFLELDTKREYFFGNYNSWNLIGTSGTTSSGGTNPTYDYIPVNSGGTFQDSFLNQTSSNVLKTTYGGDDKGLKLDFANNNYQLGTGNYIGFSQIGNYLSVMGDYTGDNLNGTTFNVNCDLQLIYSLDNGEGKGLYLDFANGNYGIVNNPSTQEGLWIGNINNPTNKYVAIGWGDSSQACIITESTKIRANYNSNDEGLMLDFTAKEYSIGNTTSGNYIKVDDTLGKVTISTLSGATTRMVVADASGILSTQTISSGGTSGAYLPLSGGSMTGGILANSGLTANTISQTSYIDFTTGSTNPSQSGGRVFFDSTSKALSYYDVANNLVPIAMGQQLYTRVYNATGTQIDKGKVIAITGTSNNLPSAILAVNTHTITSVRPIGLSAENIPNGSEGLVLNNGILSGITLNTFANGATLYLSDTTPGSYVDSTSSLSFTARTNEIGYVIQTGVTTGKIYVNINNEDSNLSLTDIERNILEGNVISSGAYEFTGLTKVSNTLFSVAPLRGWVVKNTYAYATLPDVTNVNYSGTTGTTTPYINSADATYVLVTSGSTLLLQSDFPTAKQRRQNIFLGRIVHPNRSTIQNVNNTTDFDVSPMAAIRDIWTPIKLINQGVVPSYYSANTLSIQTSAGTLWGNGIGWYTDQENPDSVNITATTPTTFQYRTSTGQTGGDTLVLDCTHYDVNGVITTIPGNNGSQLARATNQRVYLFTSGLIRIQYGQDYYESLTEAVAAIQSETFTEYPLIRDNAILIGIISVARSTTNLANNAQAHFTYVSKFGEQFGGTGGLSTTTLQQAYNNSTTPEITTSSSLGALSVKNGAGTADNVTNLFEGIPSGTTGATSFIRADGLISGSSVSAPTISGTTFYGLPLSLTSTTQSVNTLTLNNSTGGTSTYTPNAATGGTYSSGTITLLGSGSLTNITGLNTGTLTSITSGTGMNFNNITSSGSISIDTSKVPYYSTGFTTGLPKYNGSAWIWDTNTYLTNAVTSVSESNNIVTVTTNTGSTTFTIDAVTGGTYSNGTISLSGTGTLGTITGLVASAATGGTYSAGTITLSGYGSLTSITGIPTGSTGGAGLTWVNAVSPLTATTNYGYIITGTTTIALPTTGVSIGSTIEIVGTSSGLWSISQSAQHQIRFGNQTTTSGVTGVLSATTQGDCVRLICTTANNNYIVASAIGNLYFN